MGVKFILVIVLILFNSQSSLEFENHVHFLDPEDEYERRGYQANAPEIYCYTGSQKSLFRLWESVYLNISLVDNYEQFDGFTPTEVMEKFDERKSSWNFLNFYSWRKKRIRLLSFNQTCVGIVSPKQYNVKLNLIYVDNDKVFLFTIGIILFLNASYFCRNKLFYYGTGVAIGMLASFVIAIYILSRLVPKKPVMYSLVLGSWSVWFYFTQWVWENIQVVLVQYMEYVIAYASCTSLLSLAVCYRYGPVSDPRSINIIMWLLQVVGLFLIYFSTEFREASLAIILIILFMYNVPFSLPSVVNRKFYRFVRRPKARKLLTRDEYYDQGLVETNKALKELRAFCSSPDCNQWKIIAKLKDPMRFAKFVQGEPHVEEDILISEEFEKTIYNLSDDSSSE